MKKISINLIIGVVLSAILIVLAIILIKPTYMTAFNNKIYTSRDNTSFSYDNEVIKYTRQDKKITIDLPTLPDRIVYQEDTGTVYMAVEEHSFEGKHLNGTDTLEGLTVDEVLLYYKYITLLTVTHTDVTKKEVTTSILGVISAFILSFLAYPVILFDKIKKTKILIAICVPLTAILCVTSAFYIYFTLK